MGTFLDDFLEIDAIIGGSIFFFYGFTDHILHPVREKVPFWGTVEEKPKAWWPQVHKQGLHTSQKRRLGTTGVMQVQSKLRLSMFSQMEE
jgi:hypothetical protein